MSFYIEYCRTLNFYDHFGFELFYVFIYLFELKICTLYLHN